MGIYVPRLDRLYVSRENQGYKNGDGRLREVKIGLTSGILYIVFGLVLPAWDRC